MDDKWIDDVENSKYKQLGENGYWNVVRFYGDMAIYSGCPFCGYAHPCYKRKYNKDGVWTASCEYDQKQEFNYCPMCGEEMNVGEFKTN